MAQGSGRLHPARDKYIANALTGKLRRQVADFNTVSLLDMVCRVVSSRCSGVRNFTYRCLLQTV